jgi:glucosamine 6-phosphate synthetase-like amidotransferase/phosphosugar isomerase protein
MISTRQSIEHTIKNAELSLNGDFLTVTDSESKDSVTIKGTNLSQVVRELRWFIAIHVSSHNETAREMHRLQDALSKLAEATQEALKELESKVVEQAAS